MQETSRVIQSISHPKYSKYLKYPKYLNNLIDERGQATAEYGLVMLAAAAIAGLLLAWATSTDAVGRIMDAVVATIIEDIG